MGEPKARPILIVIHIDKATKEKVQAVCDAMRGATWSISNNEQQDRDGYGSAFPQWSVWEEFANALSKLVSSDSNIQKEVKKIVMVGCPVGK